MSAAAKLGWKKGDLFPVAHTARMKGIVDRASSLTEVVKRLEAQAATYRKLIKDGWTLGDMVQDDYLVLNHPEHGVAITASEAKALNAGADVPDRLLAGECRTCEALASGARPPARAGRRR